MLSNPDHQLVARDGKLPGLALLLDEDRALSALHSAWPEHRFETLATTYLNYKPGVRCLVGYLVQAPDGPLSLHAKAYTTEEYTQIRAGKAGETVSTPRLLDDQYIALWRFPDDRKLVGLARLAPSDKRCHLLSKLLPDEPALWPAGLETLRYKPERRYVGKLTVADHPAAIVKVYDERDFGNAWRGAKTVKTFTDRERLAVSRPLGRSKSQRIIVSRWLAGQPLNEWLLGIDFTAHRLREVGVALAELHRQAPGHLALIAREDEAMAVLAAANAVAVLCPELAMRVRELAPRIASELLAAPAEQCLIHGDFSADQVLMTADGIGIIDYDRAGWGDPAADFGTFIARLEYASVAGLLAATQAGEIADGLIDGYCHQTRSNKPSRTDLYVAAGLLRLAPHGFRDRQHDWPMHIERVVQRAERIFRDSSRRRAANG